MARKSALLALYKKLERKGIKVLLVQVNEAHSSNWPIGLPNQVEPQTDLMDRLQRANDFVRDDVPQYPFIVGVDGFDNLIDDTMHLWPDGWICFDHEWIVTAKSTYTSKRGNGIVDVDLVDFLNQHVHE